MAGGLGVRNHGRPPIPRSRSQTLPSSTLQDGEGPAIDHISHSSRPSYGRSSSYLSPDEAKPRITQTLATEKTSRLHLPGTARHSGEHPRLYKHRHVQSHAENLSHLVAGLEREKRQHLERQGTGGSELKRITSPRTGHIMNSRDHLRRRATSDPRTSLPIRKSSTEILLDKADARKMANRAALTPDDIANLKRAQDAADTELHNRLADLDNTSTELSRRLDYTYYELLSKVNNLKGTVESFQNLSTQSDHLITNFEHETSKLSDDVTRRVARFRSGFKDRQTRVSDLETRSNLASQKAKDLNRRLENARTIIVNWEKREVASKQKWGRFWLILWWTVIPLTVVIMVLVTARLWWFGGDPVAAALDLHHKGSRNRSLGLDREIARNVDVPVEVREVLEGIAERRRTKHVWPSLPRVEEDVSLMERKKDEERLRLLDEL